MRVCGEVHTVPSPRSGRGQCQRRQISEITHSGPALPCLGEQHILPPSALTIQYSLMGELYILSPLSFLCHVPSSIQLGIPDEFLTRDRADLASSALPSLASFHCSNSNCEKNKFSSSYPHQLFPTPISIFTLMNLIGVNTMLWWEHSDIIW